jgi:hypothetical protein
LILSVPAIFRACAVAIWSWTFYVDAWSARCLIFRLCPLSASRSHVNDIVLTKQGSQKEMFYLSADIAGFAMTRRALSGSCN